MIEINNVDVMNFEGAIRGMRNPLNSWGKSDSSTLDSKEFILGEKDRGLAQMLISSGTDDSKFMRQIMVSIDINAPLYWWKEMDTYKVATTANSTSTMHKIASTPITKGCFSFDPYETIPEVDRRAAQIAVEEIVESCEFMRRKFLETGDKTYWRLLIQLLPEAWMQKRTWTANYAVLRNIYFARRKHKLQEWRDFCKLIESLPCARELICYEK